MAAVFDQYSEPLARYLFAGFTFRSQGGLRRFDGLRQRHELHDLVAETFRRAFEPRARLAYDGLKPYDLYLFTIARNLVIDRLRSRSGGKIVQQSDTDAAPPPDEAGVSPEQAYQDEELSRLMRTFLETLSPDERRFVGLRYRDGLSQLEVAGKMNRTRRWVRTREVKLRQRLVKHLRSTGYLEPLAATGKAGT